VSILQKWLAGMTGLGAVFLVVSNPNGVYKAAQAVRTAVGGTVVDITTGGKK
jgi:ribosomal protein S8